MAFYLISKMCAILYNLLKNKKMSRIILPTGPLSLSAGDTEVSAGVHSLCSLDENQYAPIPLLRCIHTQTPLRSEMRFNSDFMALYRDGLSGYEFC